MIQPRGSQLRVLYDPNFAPQSNIATANSVATLTAVLQVTNRTHLQLNRQVDPVYDCSGQEKISEQLLSRSAKLVLEFDANVPLIKGFLRACMGAGTGVNLTMLSQSQFQPPFLTMALGFIDSPDPGVLFKGVIVNSFKILAKARERVKCTMELIGFGDMTPATGLTWPACSEVLPLYSHNCGLTINSVDRMVANGAAGTATTEIEFEYSNNADAGDDSFQLADIDPTRIERADRRTHMFNWKVQGYLGDATHAAAITNPSTIWPISFRVGSAIDNVTISATEAILTAEDNAQTFEGEFGRTCLNLKLEPTLAAGALPLVGVATA